MAPLQRHRARRWCVRRSRACKPSPDAIPCSQPTQYHVRAAVLRTAFQLCCSLTSLVTPPRCRCLAGAVQKKIRARGADCSCLQLHKGVSPGLPLVSLLHSVQCQTCHADMCAGDRTCAQPTACMMRDSNLHHPPSGLPRSRAHTFLRHQSDRARPNAKSSASLFVARRCAASRYPRDRTRAQPYACTPRNVAPCFARPRSRRSRTDPVRRHRDNRTLRAVGWLPAACGGIAVISSQ